MITALCDATLFTGEALVEGHTLLIQDGKILDIVTNANTPADAQKKSYGGRLLTAGFIDAQVNGGGNLLFHDAPTAATCLAIAKAHRKSGTTHLLPTCMTESPAIIGAAITATRAARKTSDAILGIHLEGPHLSLERRGIHAPEKIRALTPDDLALYRRTGDEVFLMTLAPENATPQQIHTLRHQGVTIALGHTAAKPDAVRDALRAGATGFTHLFNGMGGISARACGVAGIALDDRDSWCSLIADGHHLSPEVIRLALRAKPRGKVFLISDAMPPVGADSPHDYTLYDEKIHVTEGRCVNSNGTLAGAFLTLADAVRYVVKQIGVPLEEALRMASTYPAAFLGVEQRLGKLLPTYDAAVLAMDEDLKIEVI